MELTGGEDMAAIASGRRPGKTGSARVDSLTPLGISAFSASDKESFEADDLEAFDVEERGGLDPEACASFEVGGCA
jgi:hypothetical protein